MKIKYIFSMVAGLIVLVTASCSEKTTTEADAEKEASETVTEVTTPETQLTVSESVEAPMATPSAYYVMFTGKGWGIGRRASSALSELDGVKSVILSGLRATVRMKDGMVLDEEKLAKAITAKNLTYVSKSPAMVEAPKVVYVLNVSGVGWSETEEKARVALAEVENVTNVYVGKKTEVWMTEDGTLDKDAITTTLDGFGLKVSDMEKTDKSAL